jgi:hypothetical protein
MSFNNFNENHQFSPPQRLTSAEVFLKSAVVLASLQDAPK